MTFETIAGICGATIALFLLLGAMLFVSNLVEDFFRVRELKRIKELESIKFPIFRESKPKRKK